MKGRGNRASRVGLPITGAVVLILWLATIFAADAPWLVVTLFWLAAGAALGLWVHLDMRKHAGQFSGMARSLESALRRNAAAVYDIRARRFAELEEIEDEGACYAFELDDGRLVFISGQEFYQGARFPSLDFSLVYVLDERGEKVDMVIDKRGTKTAPARLIPGTVKRTLDVPDHLETRLGTVETVEASIGPCSGSR